MVRQVRPEPYHFFINKNCIVNSVFTEMKIIGNRVTDFSVFYVADSSTIVM